MRGNHFNACGLLVVSPILLTKALCCAIMIGLLPLSNAYSRQPSDVLPSQSNNNEVRRIHAHQEGVWRITCSPDGQTIASGGLDGKVRVWDVTTGEALRTWRAHSNSRVMSLCFFPSGKTLVTAGEANDSDLRVWDLDTGKELLRARGHELHVVGVAVSPDGRRIVSASRDETLRLWDRATGRELRRCSADRDELGTLPFDYTWTMPLFPLLRGTGPIEAMALAPNGSYAATASADMAVRLWDITTGKEIRRFIGHKDPLKCIAFTPDGRHIVGAGQDTIARLWVVATGEEKQRFQGHEETILSIAVSPDSQLLATGSGWRGSDRVLVDCTVRVWDLKSGKQLACYTGHTDVVTSVAFAHKQQVVVSGSLDGTIRIWQLGNNTASRPRVQQEAPPKSPQDKKDWEVVSLGSAGLSVPANWRTMPSVGTRMQLFRQGDGLGVPAMDEQGEPLQIGITVEKFPNTKETSKEGIEDLLKELKRNPRFQLLGKETLEPIKLSDGAEGHLLTVEMLKDRSRRSLYLKLLVKDRDSNGWVITGYLISGKDSKLSAANSYLAKRLRVHVVSFCLDKSKLDEQPLQQLYRRR